MTKAPKERAKWNVTREPRGFKYVSLTYSLLFLMVMSALALLEIIPAWIAASYVGFSALSYLAYGYDKKKARLGMWRTAEATLHLLDAFGGWPGGLAGQQVFRHKTRKWMFQPERRDCCPQISQISQIATNEESNWLITVLSCLKVTNRPLNLRNLRNLRAQSGVRVQIVFWITAIAHIAYWVWAVSLHKVPAFSDVKRLMF